MIRASVGFPVSAVRSRAQYGPAQHTRSVGSCDLYPSHETLLNAVEPGLSPGRTPFAVTLLTGLGVGSTVSNETVRLNDLSIVCVDGYRS